jgi:hypothetical protein
LFNPERVESVPDVALVIFNLVAFKKSPGFVLERCLFVMLLLIRNIPSLRS